MGSRSEYKCSKCGKEWVEDFTLFYLMSDDRLEHHGIVMLTPKIERRSVAKGFVNETYCRNCDKDIKLYLLEEVKTEIPYIDPNRILEEYKHDSNKIFGSYEEFKKGNVVNCPKCKEEIVLKESFGLYDEFYLNCNVYESTCDNCGEFYIFYAIKPERRQYTEEEALEKIEKLLDDNCLLGLAKDYESITEIHCPCCDKMIPKQNNLEKCPKCDGELEGGLTMMYD